ncbi:RNA-binding S4 domain-containing protein [Mesohalobacter halotolerans]|uniref:RNA-binding S4 domain-containing protein n=1 Tax=Mesohalobacter halotolerans TaxID=1883405 RepID=A0A4U5TNW6_9FLAO|nr:S4 domain-containing protein [Mesohalobacter halotolerans]MBS3738914.1 RNA-binding S4 domain-containing protein [Psychroflexus sp.]TKS55737.1 RNA-binding S4 domain-containing protein [Mesohalobacter halotolerans]
MRVDKYLWCVRYFKTRSKATRACKKGHVEVNGEKVKPSREVYPADEINMRKNQIDYKIQVLDLPKSRVGAKLTNIYRLDKTPQSAFKAQEKLKYAQEYYRKKGTGRPTKKDRRDIDDFLEKPDNKDLDE